ncbi:aldehyde dehydrogenase family protein, partial [Escherichia coli]|nr:aldehyde dehydrogenase family protein [Escherichia coli]
MNMTITTKPSVFKNEPFTDFTVEANKVAMEKALEKVKGKLGGTYPISIGSETIDTGDYIVSINPGSKDDVIGRVSKGTTALAEQAMQQALTTFEMWKNVSPAERADYLFKAADLMRQRKHEF